MSKRDPDIKLAVIYELVQLLGLKSQYGRGDMGVAFMTTLIA